MMAWQRTQEAHELGLRYVRRMATGDRSDTFLVSDSRSQAMILHADSRRVAEMPDAHYKNQSNAVIVAIFA